MNVRLLDSVETRCVFPAGGEPVALNDVAARFAYETTRAELEDGSISAIWKFPVGSEVTVPQATADELVRLGYAAAI